MKTVSNILHQMTDSQGIMQALREVLREIDPEFAPTEARYQAAAEALESQLGDSISPSVSDYLRANEEVFACEVIYIGWLGFQLNMDIFNNPVNALLLKGDYEDFHRERRFETLPAARKSREVQEAFLAELRKSTEEQQLLADEVSEFYSYLATAGYKIAHYIGFRLADRFLHYVIPGYVSDPVVTLQYSSQLQDDLQIDLGRIE